MHTQNRSQRMSPRRRHAATVFGTALLLMTLLGGCSALQPKPLDPLEYVPPEFTTRFPVGTQQRDWHDVARSFGNYSLSLMKLHDSSLRHRGGMCVAIAIKSDGSVAAAEQISSNLEDPQLQARVLELIRGIPFGPATGNGYYVVGVPVDFDSMGKWVNYCARAA